MQYRTLPNTDISVSTIAMGCWAIVGDATWGWQDEKQALDAINHAVDLGINFFDTAEGYGAGQSERLLARALGDRRSQVVIASKASPNHLAPKDLIDACERSLHFLDTDYIDIYQLHWPNRNIPIDQSIQALEQLKQQGKIRAFGVSNFGVQDINDLPPYANCVSNQLAYNLLARSIEYGIQQKCIERDIAILCYSPIAQGLLTGKFKSACDVPEGRARTRHFSSRRPGVRHNDEGYEQETFHTIDAIYEISEQLGRPMVQVALAWCLHQPGIASVIAGARNPQQVDQNALAADLDLHYEVIEQLNEITDPLKQCLGPNADLWEDVTRPRIH